MLSLIDSHAHLDSQRFDRDRDKVIRDARRTGVVQIVNPGADLESSRKAVELADRYPEVFAAVGVHPHDASTLTDGTLAGLTGLADNPRVVAIGEIGLDYYRDLSPRDRQRTAFVRQLALARTLGLPVIVHIRDAHRDAMRMLEEEAEGTTGVLHCYSGDLDTAQRAISLGWYISIAGPVTYPNAHRLRDVVSQLPLERLLIETDCPYLSPQPRRGKRNEPAYVRWVAEQLAETLQVDLERVAEVTSSNTRELFGLPEAG
jgi:TatD DNase family protein